MFEELYQIEERFDRLENELAQPEIINDRELYQKTVRQHAELSKVVYTYRQLKKLQAEKEETQELLRDPDEEIRQMAETEVARYQELIEAAQKDLEFLLLPKDPNDEKNVLLEIRAGTGGEEAALFVADLFRMYSRFAEKMNWRVEVMGSHPTGSGGFKEIIAMVEGNQVFSQLKYESGVHRVQRVPTTESQGRIHTSAVTVAVLPEAEDVEVEVNPDEIKVDVYRSSGPGGQSVNTTDSAVRITHLPTGLVVTCQDEKSQYKNKAKALKVLKARLLDIKVREQQDKISEDRRDQVGTGDRSERIRTYNFPQGRLTDHRINLTLYRLDSIMEGDIQEIIDTLTTHYQTEALKTL
ncbi:MAG: peptide chain release factor 1 [Deltaproteobacteria bacterium]|nr:peptide chain release factor 1 [Deltaproteobacteria bacterium]MBW2051817.1 peptide chain release factor 1 [Deltaproteobacteria bacterium]MBW2139691.1 peptide chain release factor 1 [Deltaproteobacteria bacterium]MBW2322429.1 peptide chain release factor 1 [Deltaproteobacteria bacterium]